MTRRSDALLCVIAFAVLCPSAARALESGRPNVLLILADDLGFSDLGCYGGEIATPNLDALAKGGLRFRQFTNGTRCCPSRASLLTGLYPHQAGVGDMNGDGGRPGYRGFPQPNTVTIAEVLKSAGYHTSMVGKWHLSAGPKTPRPTDRGFDEFYGMIGGFNLHRGDQLAEMGGPKTYHSYGSGWANAGNTPFRLYKHDCHEGGIRTPFIAHWPKGIGAKGEVRDQPGHLIDLLATCVAISGAIYPTTFRGATITPMEGTSLLPAFANRPLGRELLAWEHEGNRAIRVGNWKLVAKSGAAWELYDLDADPVELKDLAAARPEKVGELSAKWDDWARRCQVLRNPERKE